ncbi:MAG: hypothetical protein IKA55_03230 [Akkermansia sp.]|nr:hypothetical protein [Akkermansia sp.]
MKDFLHRHPVLCFLLTIASWLVAVPGVAASCFLLAQLLMTVCSERVYEINPAEPVRTELDGKLVKLLADEVRSGSGPLELEAFGLRKENALLLSADYSDSERKSLFYLSIDGKVADRILVGNYELKLDSKQDSPLLDGVQAIPTSQVTLPPALQKRLKETTSDQFVLTGGTHLQLSYVPSPVRANEYLYGRLKGNSIHVQSYLRGQESFRNFTHEHALTIISLEELALGLLCVLPCALVAAWFALCHHRHATEFLRGHAGLRILLCAVGWLAALGAANPGFSLLLMSFLLIELLPMAIGFLAFSLGSLWLSVSLTWPGTSWAVCLRRTLYAVLILIGLNGILALFGSLCS